MDCMSLTPFSTVLQLYCGGQCTYPCFPGVLLTNTPHSILSKPLAAFPHNQCKKKKKKNGQQGEREMNPVAITIISPQREYFPSQGSNQQPPV